CWHAHYWMGLSVRARTEPCWSPLDQPRPEQCRHIEQLTLRAPLPTDARLMWEWERLLLTGSPFHLKLPTEVSGPPRIAAELAANVVRKDRFLLAAFAGPGPSRIVGLVHAWIEPGVRVQHDVMFGLNVLPEWSANGVGAKLASALEAWARSRGIRRLTT